MPHEPLYWNDKSMTGTPKAEPRAEFRVAARQLREMYVAFTDVGFTPDEAMGLIAMSVGMGGNGGTAPALV